MFRSMFLIVFMILLSGCSQISKQPIFPDIAGLLISSTSIPATGSWEFYEGSSGFDLLKDVSGCVVDTGGMVLDSNRVYCRSISGYNHLYQIPAMKLEYLYEPARFGYSDTALSYFLNAIGLGYPMVVSSGMMYRSSDVLSNSKQDVIVVKSKSLHQDPESVVKSYLNDGCDFRENDASWLLSGGEYIGYDAENYRVKNGELVFGDKCFKDDIFYSGDSSWVFVFAKESKDYYYIVGVMGPGNGVYSYANHTLKLFVE